MKNFKKKWDKKPIEDWHTVCSDDYKSFCKAFKNYLKRSFPDAEIIGFKANHYDTSGFIHEGDNYIYVSHSMNRYSCRVDFSETGAMNGVLYRTAKDAKDYTGGINHFTSINNMVEDILLLLGKPKRNKECSDTGCEAIKIKNYSDLIQVKSNEESNMRQLSIFDMVI